MNEAAKKHGLKDTVEIYKIGNSYLGVLKKNNEKGFTK